MTKPAAGRSDSAGIRAEFVVSYTPAGTTDPAARETERYDADEWMHALGAFLRYAAVAEGCEVVLSLTPME